MSPLIATALAPSFANAQNSLRANSGANENPPAWSPTPFQTNPLRQSNSTPQSNSTGQSNSISRAFQAPSLQAPALHRPTAAEPAKLASDPAKQAEVLRWRKVDLPAVSAKPTIKPPQNAVAEQTTAPVVTTAAYQDPTSKPPQAPRSSLLVQQPALPTVQPIQEPQLESLLPPVAQPPALTLPPANQPPANQPPALSLPPALPVPEIQAPAPIPESVLPKEQPPVIPEKIPEKMPEKMPENAGALPNPFPKPSAQERVENSPSDRKLREPARLDEPSKLDDDLPPAPPKRAEQSVANCDMVRDFAAGADIRNFQLNSSPEFVQGYQSVDRPGSLTKDKFVEKSPMRTWRGSQGEYISEGKLVDLVYGTVVIEQSDGKRVSYLQRKLSDADQVFVSEAWGVPVTCPLGDQGFAPRLYVDSTFTWKASAACNKPLYFEDVSLERYGHEWGPVVQPMVSTVRFFGDLAVLPYKMGIHPPNECQHPLGYYRPGSCAPWSLKAVPLSMRGAATQAAFVTGTVFALP